MNLTSLKLDGLDQRLSKIEQDHGRWRVIVAVAMVFEYEGKPLDVVQRTAYCRNNGTRQHDYCLLSVDSRTHHEQTDVRLTDVFNDFNPRKPLALVFSDRRGPWRSFNELQALSGEVGKGLIDLVRETLKTEIQRQTLDDQTVKDGDGRSGAPVGRL